MTWVMVGEREKATAGVHFAGVTIAFVSFVPHFFPCRGRPCPSSVWGILTPGRRPGLVFPRRGPHSQGEQGRASPPACRPPARCCLSGHSPPPQGSHSCRGSQWRRLISFGCPRPLGTADALEVKDTLGDRGVVERRTPSNPQAPAHTGSQLCSSVSLIRVPRVDASVPIHDPESTGTWRLPWLPPKLPPGMDLGAGGLFGS